MTIKRPDVKNKVILVGDPHVGKSTLINTYCKGNISEDPKSTIGSNFIILTVKTLKGQVDLCIWDTFYFFFNISAGQEMYKGLIPMYSRGASASVIVIDVTNPSSLKHVDDWIDITKEGTNDNCLFYVAANKVDLTLLIGEDEVRDFCKKRNLPFFFTTSKSIESISVLFTTIANDLVNCYNNFETGINILDLEERGKSCCS